MNKLKKGISLQIPRKQCTAYLLINFVASSYRTQNSGTADYNKSTTSNVFLTVKTTLAQFLKSNRFLVRIKNTSSITCYITISEL